MHLSLAAGACCALCACTTTSSPASAREYAINAPLMPAPITATSQSMSSMSGGKAAVNPFFTVQNGYPLFKSIAA